MLFGPRKSEAPKKPSTREPRQPERQRALAQSSQQELREALGEIGVALGFPESMIQEDSSQKESVETADYPGCLPQCLLTPKTTLDKTAGMDRGASLFPMGPAPEETAAYDHWQETSVPETLYEADALFAEEEAFEARESDQTRQHKDESPEAATEGLSPYERPNTSAHVLRRLAARTPLQQAVVMKELLDRPVSLRRRSGLPFRT